MDKEKEIRRIVPLLSFIIFFSVLNGTMFNVAIPDIALQFGLSPSQVSWVVTGYIVFFSIGSVTYGKLADIFPVRHLISIGLLTFSVGSLVGTFAQWYPMLIAGRMIQATGSAAIPALAMLVATRYFPPQKRGSVLGTIASTVAFASAVGPIVGGFIAGMLHWRYLFLISLLTLFTIPFFQKWLPREEKGEGRFDLWGAIFLAAGIAGFLLFISRFIWWILPVSLLFLIVFVRHIHRVEHPFIQPRLFRNNRFRNVLITGFLAVGTVFGMMFMVPLMLKDLNHLTSAKIGMVMFPGAISAAFLGTYGGRLTDRIGGVPVVIIGLFLLALGFFGLSSLAGSVSWIISIVLILCYTGFSFLQSSLASTVSNTLSQEQTGVGMGIYNLVFFMAGAFSFSIVGKILDVSRVEFIINPLLQMKVAAIYSNLFFTFIAFILLSLTLFLFTFHRDKKRTPVHSS